MKMKSLILLFTLALMNTYCDDEPPPPSESFDTMYVDVKQGETIEYFTTIEMYQSNLTVDSTKHHLLSEFFRDSTEYNLYHRYQPLEDFQGKDTLKLRREQIDDVHNDVISIKNVTVVLTVE